MTCYVLHEEATTAFWSNIKLLEVTATNNDVALTVKPL